MSRLAMIMKTFFSSTIFVIVSLLAVAEAQDSLPVKSPTSGHPNELTSYSVSSCSGASVISFSDFNMTYDRFSHIVNFSMIGTAQQDDLSPFMLIDAASYGTKLPTQVIDLCQNIMCPLAQISTPIQGNQTLNQSYTNQIPAIFWSLPLDATVKLTFVDSGGNQLSCLTSKLYNGITTQNAFIPWVTGFLTLGLMVVAGILGVVGGAGTAATGANGGVANAPGPGTAPASHATTATTTHAGHSGPPGGRMDPVTLFLHFQSISSTGLLSVSYPSVYHAFTTNFAWANLILPLRAFRKAAAHMRKCNNNSAIPSVRSTSDLGVSSGIATYSAQLGIDVQDVFGIVYIVFLCACGAILGLYLIAGAFMHITSLRSSNEERKAIWETRRHQLTHMSSNNTLRVFMLALGTLATFAFYQWTQTCTSGLTFFLSASVLAFALLTLGTASFFIIYISKKADGLQKLFSKDSTYGRRWGSMYDTLNEGRLYFAVIFWVVVLIRSAIVGFGQSSGFAQVVALIVLELVVCISIFKYQPYYSRGYNRVNYLLQGTKLVSNVLLLIFVDKLHMNAIATTAVGFALLVINSLVALFLVVLTVLKLGWGRLWFRRKHAAFEQHPQIQGVHAIHYEGPMTGTDDYEDK